MNTTEVNREILNSIYQQYPYAVDELKLEGDFLVYKNERVDISKFNLNDLIYGDSEFAHSLVSLKSGDVFTIIKMHVQGMELKSVPKPYDDENIDNTRNETNKEHEVREDDVENLQDVNSDDTLSEKEEKDKKKIVTENEFLAMFSPSIKEEFTLEEKETANVYYSFYKDLINYEDYALPWLKDMLRKFRAFVTDIEIRLDNVENATIRERELLSKRDELEEQKKDFFTKETKQEDYVRKLTLQNHDQIGSTSTLQVVALIVGIVILLTIITLSLIG